MPTQRITKEMVIDTAFQLARKGGMEQVLVKAVAAELGCSVQPIYSYCNNMEELRCEVADRTRDFVKSYIAAHIDTNDLFHSIGHAYIQLTKEEPQLFKIFILRQRDGITSFHDLYRSDASEEIPAFIAETLHIHPSQAKQLHLDMLIYTIGIGTILSVTTPGPSTDEIFAQQERVYQIFLKNILEDDHGR